MALLYGWAFRNLPRERWQVLASLPLSKSGEDWEGLNLTYYGFFSATASAAGAALFIVLTGAAGVPLAGALSVAGLMLAVCAPAARLIARFVEGKRYAFTVGGAFFTGLLAAPVAVAAVNATAGRRMGFEAPMAPVLAALSIAYVVGESAGRLACISFGCCYGKPVARTGAWLRRLCRTWHFTFEGKTKKIAFAANLDGVEVVPIQAVTAAVLGLVALASLGLFLGGRYRWAICAAIVGSQVWRAVSETLRADYRGGQRVSAYQIMAACAAAAGLAGPWLLPEPAVSPGVTRGLSQLWTPEAILFLEAAWLAQFLFMGRSQVTGARMSFHVRRSRI